MRNYIKTIVGMSLVLAPASALSAYNPSSGGMANPATSNLDMSTHEINFGADPGDGANGINFSNAQQVCWESSPAAADVCMSVDANELFRAPTIYATTRFYTENGSANPVAYGMGSSGTGWYSAGTSIPTLMAGDVQMQQFDWTKGLTFQLIQQIDVGATCALGDIAYDTGGATDELCYCQATNTWRCVTLSVGPAD